MIITDDFVLLNYPRTGSTFVRQELRTLYGQAEAGPARRLQGRLGWGCPRFLELEHRIDRTASARAEGRRSQHGAVSQIPARHRHRPRVSITRHPLDRVVSFYEHGFWREHPPGDRQAIVSRFPSFPELDFGQYLELMDEFGLADVLQGAHPAAEVGPFTVQFVRFYAEEPESALAGLTDAAIEDGKALAPLRGVRFLRFERLVDELATFLQELGFGPEQTARLHGRAPVNAAVSRAGRPWTEYFDAEREARFRQRERLLFRLFPDYGERP